MTRADEQRLSAFKKDLDRLTREAEELAESYGAQSRLAGEEAVGAEILVSRDLVAHLGILWDTMEQLGDIAGRQARYFTDDYRATLGKLLGGSGADNRGAALARLLENRLTHLAEGLEQGIEVMSAQSEKACEALFELWSPFFSVVRQDWSRQRSRAQAR